MRFVLFLVGYLLLGGAASARSETLKERIVSSQTKVLEWRCAPHDGVAAVRFTYGPLPAVVFGCSLQGVRQAVFLEQPTDTVTVDRLPREAIAYGWTGYRVTISPFLSP